MSSFSHHIDEEVVLTATQQEAILLELARADRITKLENVIKFGYFNIYSGVIGFDDGIHIETSYTVIRLLKDSELGKKVLACLE